MNGWHLRPGAGRRWAGRARRAMAAAGAVALVAACGSGAGSGQAGRGSSATWVHGILNPKGDSGYEFMAQERGLYRQLGVDVQIKEFVGNVQLTQALVSGSIDSGETSLEPPYSAISKGADLKIIGSTLPGDTYAVVAKSSVGTWADLEGKTIGASAPGSFPDLITRAMLAVKGLDPRGVTVVSTGDDAQRLQALIAGRIDAAAMSVAFIPQLKDHPQLHVLGLAQDIVPLYPRFMVVANGRALRTKPDAAARFLAATMRGVCYAVQNPKAEEQVTAKEINQSPDDPGIVYAQQVIAQAHAASPTAAIPMDKLQYLQQLRIRYGFQQRPIDFSKVVDTSVRRQALSLANLPAACASDPNARS
jgi:NitT/TauT family transport system substrate-binding protein